MTALLDLEPGSVGPDTARQELGARLAAGAVAALPPSLSALVDLGTLVAHTTGAVAAAAAAGGAAAAIPAVGAAVAAVTGAGRLLAGQLDQETADAIDAGLRSQATTLVAAANGKILAPFSTSPLEQTGAPPSEARVYTGPGRDAAEVRGNWSAGAVAVVPRTARSSCIWSLCPWAEWDSIRDGAVIRPGRWADETGPTIAGVYLRASSLETQQQQVRRALRRGEWPEDWITRSPVGEWRPGQGGWLLRLVDAGLRLPAVPAICRRTLAPGLAPLAGPQGQPIPVAGELLAYAAGLAGAPPPDLDLVIERARAIVADAGALGATGYLAALQERLRVLAWAREDRRRRGGGSPRAWDPFAGAPDLGPGAALQAGGPAALKGYGGGGSGGSGGNVASDSAGSAALLLLPAAAGALFLLRRRHR